MKIDPARLEAIVDLWRSKDRPTEISMVGGSMEPVLRAGWTLCLEHGHQRHPFGTIIVFLQGHLLVAHRVVRHRGDGAYITKGDALVHFDRQPVVPERVLGQVVAARHSGGTISFSGPRSRRRAWRLALFSRLVGEAYRVTRPLTRLAGPVGRISSRLPGPTRLLRALTRTVLGARRRSQRSASDGSPGDIDSPGGAA